MFKKVIYLALILLFLAGCSSKPIFPEQEALIHDHDFKLSPCPKRPNCVSTEAVKDDQKIAAFDLAMPIDKAWPLIVEAVAELPRTSVQYVRDGYLYAQSRSLIFRFVDNLEILYVPNENRLSVKSGALLGYKDFSVNRDRTEALRSRLIESNVIKP